MGFADVQNAGNWQAGWKGAFGVKMSPFCHIFPRAARGAAFVAQICNLPYRGIAFRVASGCARDSTRCGALPIANRRYGRVQLCATTAEPSQRGGIRLRQRFNPFRRTADCKSAIRQSATLRYDCGAKPAWRHPPAPEIQPIPARCRLQIGDTAECNSALRLQNQASVEASACARDSTYSGALPIANRRYGRVQLCATTTEPSQRGGIRLRQRFNPLRRAADCKSAIRQSATLRYDCRTKPAWRHPPAPEIQPAAARCRLQIGDTAECNSALRLRSQASVGRNFHQGNKGNKESSLSSSTRTTGAQAGRPRVVCAWKHAGGPPALRDFQTGSWRLCAGDSNCLRNVFAISTNAFPAG